MAAKKFLVATDFSEHGNAAVRYAASLARDSRAQLLILHVIQPPPPYGAAGPLLGTSVQNLFHQMLEEALPPKSDIDHQSHVLVGVPADVILHFADENDVDMIVLGTHGRTGAARLLTGSVAETVIRRSSRPVLTIRQPIRATVGDLA